MSENANPYPDELKAMHVALAKAQGEFPTITKDKTAQAGSYSYEYAGLATILAGVRPVLAKNGLALIQRLENPSGGGPSIRTELRHADGGVIASSFPLGEWSTMQQLGSRITYIRRYALCAMLGIAAEEDDDGRLGAAVSPHGSSATSSAEESPFQPPDLPEEIGPEDLTAAQRRKIFAIRTKLIDAKIFSEEQFKAQMNMSYGVDSVSGLTKDQASELIERLLKAEEQLSREQALLQELVADYDRRRSFEVGTVPALAIEEDDVNGEIRLIIRGEIEKLALGKDDKVVITVRDTLSVPTLRRLRAELVSLFPDHQVIVMSGGTELKVVKEEV